MEASGNYIDISTQLKNEFEAGIKDLENVVGCIDKDCCAPGTIFDINMKQCSVQCPSGQIMQQVVDAAGNIKSDCSGVTQVYSME